MKATDLCPRCTTVPGRAPQTVLKSRYADKLVCPTCGNIYDKKTGKKVWNYKEEGPPPEWWKL